MKSISKLRFHAENRTYDLSQPRKCTDIVIDRADWPGNEFALWLPEGAGPWDNSLGEEAIQEWKALPDGSAEWRRAYRGADIVSRVRADDDTQCLWFGTTVTNVSGEAMTDFMPSVCFHMVNAPEFISIRGERLWACLDGKWTTTDITPRNKAFDPRWVVYLKDGLRADRAVTLLLPWQASVMPETVSHPLFIAESFDRKKSVGIVSRNFGAIVNNNSPILRCIHSEPIEAMASAVNRLTPGRIGISPLEPGATSTADGVILFCDGDHEEMLMKFEAFVPRGWWYMDQGPSPERST